MAKFLDDTGLSHLWGKITAALGTKQNTLTPGTNVSISNDTISATDTWRPIRAIKDVGGSTVQELRDKTLIITGNNISSDISTYPGADYLYINDTQPNSWHATSETDRTGTDWASTPTTENIELPNNSTKSVGTFQLTAGVWIVEVAVNFNSNANGRRVMGIAGTKDASDFGGTINMVSTRAVDGTNTVLSKTVLLYPSATTRYHVIAFQNRGGGLYVYPRYRAIKIL